MSKRDVQRSERRRMDSRKIWSIVASIFLPPLGVWLVWNARWTKTQKTGLSALAAVCFVAISVLLFWPSDAQDGGIEYVVRKPEVEVYGPEFPVANVSSYIAPVSQSVLADDEDETATYVYATPTGECYHLYGCKYAYESAQKMTLYEAYFRKYQICPTCNPPAYVAGSMN